MKQLGLNHIIIIVAAVFVALHLSGCAPSVSILNMGVKTFSYDIPPQVKLEGVTTIAVLPSKTDETQTLQAKLMEGLQKKLNVNVIDIQQLTNIIQERKLKDTSDNIRKSCDKTNVDLFLVAEDIGGQVAFKVIDKDGRVALARFLKGNGEAQYVDQIIKILAGYKKNISDQIAYMFPPDDKSKDEIISLLQRANYSEAESKMKQAIASYRPGYERALFHMCLAYLYETQGRFEDALKEIDNAEQNNQKAGAFKHLQPEVFTNARNTLHLLVEAESELKTAGVGLSVYKKGRPNVAIIEFDTKAITDKYLGWHAAVYISTRLAQSNVNVYDCDFLRSLLQIETPLSEKEMGELLGVDKLIYGKFLKKTPVQVQPIYREEQYEEINVQTRQLVTRTRSVIDKTSVTYAVEIQGRIVDVKTAFGRFNTVSKDPVTVEYPGGRDAPIREREFEREWEIKLYDQLCAWIEKELSQ